MANEMTEKSRTWTMNDLYWRLDELQPGGGDSMVHLVVSDGTTGQVLGCSEFSIFRDANNLILSGHTANSPKED